jgi:opacity protein-like surface antigen
MKDQNNDMDKLFSELIEPAETLPPASAWSRIDRNLSAALIARKQKIKTFRLVSLLILLLGSIFVYFSLPHKPLEKALATNGLQQTTPPQGSDLTPTPLPHATTSDISSRVRIQPPTLVSASSAVLKQKSEYSAPSRANETRTAIAQVQVRSSSYEEGTHYNPAGEVIQSRVLPANTLDQVSKQNGESPVLAKLSNKVASEAGTPMPEKNETAAAVVKQDTAVTGPETSAIVSTSIPPSKGPSNSLEVASLGDTRSQDYLPAGQRARFSLTVFFSPDNSNRFLNSSDNDESKETMLNEKEIPAFSFSSGLKLGYDLNTHWSFFAYLGVSTATQTIKSQTIYAEDDAIPHYCMKTSFGTIDLPNSGTGVPHPNDSLYIKTDSKLTLQFINLPLVARYTLKNKRLSWYAFGGLSVNYLVGEHIIIELPGIGGDRQYKVPTPEDVHKWNIGALAGLGMRYDLSKSFGIQLEPTYRTALTSINSGSAVKSYPFTLGISAGVTYHFH